MKRLTTYLVLLLVSMVALANMLASGSRMLSINPQPSTLNPQPDSDTVAVPVRWRVQPTVPITVADLDTSVLDLRRPDNLKQTVELDTIGGGYRIGMKIGDSYLNTPILMSADEYLP